MAWNQPNNGQPPNNGGQRPSDIDEALQKINQGFSRWFGQQGGDPDLQTLKIVGVVIVALVFMMGFYRVEQAEEAVVLRFGKFSSTQTAGLHWAPPLIDEVKKINIQRIEQVPVNARMITEDTNIVEISLTVQYRIIQPVDYLLKVANPEASLLHATESALRHVVGGAKMSQILNEGRATLARDIQPRLQAYLDRYQTGIQVAGVNILEALPPKEVKAAFDDVIRAKEDKERLKNQAETYANGIVPEARGKAARIVAEAEGYKQEVVDRAKGDAARFDQLVVEYKKSPQVTRQRLYLETMESVLAKTNKVLIENNGNNMIYVPLDKIVNGNSAVLPPTIVNEAADSSPSVRMPSQRPSRAEGN
ncbi:FtsH protease activity modulator HflK [Agitococcus lubricus]|uniref:Protein HflK n=1 Tax=Agitococcus lubricus TaxID=1077255 RepID=A0A2T5IYP7_9GAMM|nr:FtsH protease activity modulator HflK [Agitococcus lubricus]PTQ89130.1 protease FtsH subunit HflK [Agitococcus lubricus]